MVKPIMAGKPLRFSSFENYMVQKHNLLAFPNENLHTALESAPQQV